VSFSLIGTTTTTPFAMFSSREAGSNRPELITASAAPVSNDIVLYASDASHVAGSWVLVSDPTAAAGLRIRNPDAGAPKGTTPLANPADYFELTFAAQAGRGYRLWIRGKADRDLYVNDSAWVQFSDSVTSAGTPTYRINSTSATAYVLEDCGGCHVHGWGWQDNGYGTGVLGPLIYFATSGSHTMRLQTREDGLSIDQVLLLSGPSMNIAPGATKDDTTIVPKP